MVKKTSIIIVTVLSLVLLALAPATYAAEQGKKSMPTTEMAQPAMKAKPMAVKLTGTIIANKNKKGKIISYALQEENGQTMMLSKHGKGMQLRKMVGGKIEATGTVYEAKHGKIITVKEFKEIK